MTALHITIRRNADGEVRVRHWPDWHAWAEHDEYWWSEGNYSCDCNREWEFSRANGEPISENPKCGEDRFSVLSITQDDDPTVVYADDEPVKA